VSGNLSLTATITLLMLKAVLRTCKSTPRQQSSFSAHRINRCTQ